MAYSDRRSTVAPRGSCVTLAPWEYLFESFNRRNFPDLFNFTWIAALGLLVALIVLYIVRTRALHQHPPYVEMWEWIWWTGLITFSLILVGARLRVRLLPDPGHRDHRARRRSSGSASGGSRRSWPPTTVSSRSRSTPRPRSSPSPRPPSASAAVAAGSADAADPAEDAHRDPTLRRRASTSGRSDRVARV